jgi:hypothetical protein
MATCPAGHASASADFCDVCGVLIGAAPSLDPSPAAPGPAAPGPAAPGAGPAAAGRDCPRCGAPHQAGQFCEACGFDLTSAASARPPVPVPAPAPAQVPAPAPAPPTVLEGNLAPGAGTWAALVTANRSYYETVQAAGGPDAASIAFPAYCPERRFRLSGAEVRIGRHSTSSGIDPEIDLSVPPADPGVSRLHAVLLKSPDGTWSVVDPGSANGTWLNGAEIAQNEVRPVRDGDRIHLGAWTELRLIREA